MTKEICEVAIQQDNAPDLKGRLPLDLGLLPEAVRNQLGGMRELTVLGDVATFVTLF
jgi:hypothetical protein